MRNLTKYFGNENLVSSIKCNGNLIYGGQHVY